MSFLRGAIACGTELPRRLKPAPLGVLLVLVASGCGYVGDPLTPLANVPGTIMDLTAVQRGGKLIVQFTVPLRTTEGVLMKEPPVLDLRIAPAGEPFPGGAKSIPQGTIQTGKALYVIPAAEWAGKEVRISARAVGSNSKEAEWSKPLNMAVLPAPAAPASPKAEATAKGVHLSWAGEGGVFRVFRRGPGEKTFTALGDADKPEWTDSTSEFGKEYTYIVQRIVKLENGKEAESDPSAEVAISPVDTFPPLVPEGLRANPSPNSVELNWSQNNEPDLAGYRVYRAPVGGDFEKIAETSQIPSYSDRKIEPGKAYRYAVTAFDQGGYESARSAEVTVTTAQ